VQRVKYALRAAESSDLDVLSDLYRRSSLSNDGDRASLIANPDALVFDAAPVHQERTRVAIAAGRIVGFATTCIAGDVCELVDLFVDPDWMRRGVARCLVLDVEATARSRDATRVEVTANPHALGFYASAGFRIDGEVETRFGPGLRMRLDVEP
jgi:ribosomal protein S18 acetylase RimI-like enzyme